MFEKLLQEIGLSDKEASVYLALLGVESADVSDISLKTKIKRPTVYVILQQLLKKGLASETSGPRKVIYHAEPPEHIETYIERQILSLKDKESLIKENLSQLKALHKESGEKPVVRFYEGKEGALSNLTEIFSTEDTKDNDPFAYAIYPADAVSQYFSENDRETIRKERRKKDIKIRSIYTSVKQEGLPDTDQFSERVRIDEKENKVNCDITVYKDGVFMTIFGKRVSGIGIRSKEVADTLRSLFKIAFKSLKK